MHDPLLCPIPRELSARIRAERERIGLSLREAAAILGVSFESYRQYESGKGHPKLPTLFALVEYLGMEPRALLPEWPRALELQLRISEGDPP